MTAEIMAATEAEHGKSALENLKEAFVSVRTGRANPMMLDKIKLFDLLRRSYADQPDGCRETPRCSHAYHRALGQVLPARH